MNVVIGDFNSHGVEWGYRSTDENGRLVEQWSETNQLSLVHDAKQPKSFNSKRWQQGYNPDLAFVSYSIAHLAEKDVMDAIPKTQHRPISIKLNAAIKPRNVPFRRRYNLKKAKWQSYAKEVDNGIANTDPVPENYEKFVNLVRRSSNKNIPRGCRTSYVCGLNDQSNHMYEDYQRRFAEDPFNEDTVTVGDALLEISEAQRSKWKEMIESTDFTHSSRKAWKTINKLTKDYTEPQQQCKVTVDQVAHQLLLNGKGNKLHVPRREKMPRCHRVKTNVTIFYGGHSARCQSLKEQQSSRPRRYDLWTNQALWRGYSSMVTTDDELYTEDTEIPKAMEEVKSDRHPQTRKRLYITKELHTNLTVVSHIQVVRTYDPKPIEPTDRNHDYRSASWIQTRKVYNRTTT